MQFTNLIAAGLLSLASTTIAVPHIRRQGDLGHQVEAPPYVPIAYGTATGILPTGTGAPLPIPTGSSPCPVDGAVVCNGPGYFGLCNFGSVVVQKVADGTACRDGKIVGTGIYTAPTAAVTGTYKQY